MKRSTTNRRSAGSATLETLESRQMFCFAPAPLDIQAFEVMDQAYVGEQADLQGGPNRFDVDRTAGERATKSDNVQN